MEIILISNGTGGYKFEARNPKSETNPNDRNAKKPSHVAAKPVLVITLLNIRICFEFRASDFEFGSGLSESGLRAFAWFLNLRHYARCNGMGT
jgi:hypothetical protein